MSSEASYESQDLALWSAADGAGASTIASTASGMPSVWYECIAHRGVAFRTRWGDLDTVRSDGDGVDNGDFVEVVEVRDGWLLTSRGFWLPLELQNVPRFRPVQNTNTTGPASPTYPKGSREPPTSTRTEAMSGSLLAGGKRIQRPMSARPGLSSSTGSPVRPPQTSRPSSAAPRRPSSEKERSKGGTHRRPLSAGPKVRTSGWEVRWRRKT